MFYLYAVASVAIFVLFLGFCAKTLDRYHVSENTQNKFFAGLRWATVVVFLVVILSRFWSLLGT